MTTTPAPTTVHVTINRSATVHYATVLDGVFTGTDCGAGAARNRTAPTYTRTTADVTCVTCQRRREPTPAPAAASAPAGPARIGYARVSTADQSADLQRDALTAAGCIRIFEDVMSGAKDDRPGLLAALDYLRPGDTLVIWKLDRLGRSARHLHVIAEQLQAREIELVILTMGIDTATSGGRLIFGIFAAMAEFERDLIRERTAAGLVAARARGRVGGRKPKLSDRQAKLVRDMYDEKGPDGMRAHTVAEIGKAVSVSRTTAYAYIHALEVQP